MLLKEIKFENFRQYKGKQTIEFSVDPEKNVTVILGQNTGGKTTLVQAFIWCLYGDNTFDDDNLLNAEEYQYLSDSCPPEVERKVCVVVSLIHNDREYIFERSKKYQKTNRGIKSSSDIFNILEANDGRFCPVTSDERNSVVYRILPRELAEYFFFWGERIENLDSKKNIDRAVKNFLGLSAIDNARKHLKAAGASFNRNFNVTTLNENGKKIELGQRRLDEIEKEIPKKERELEEIKKNVDYYTDEYEKYNQELENNKNSADAQNAVNNLKKRKENVIKQGNEAYSKILRDFNKKGYQWLLTFFSDDINSILDNLPDEKKGLVYQSEKSILEILNRGKCLCGCNLKEGDQLFNHVLSELEKLPPKSISSSVDEYKKFFNLTIDNVSEFHSDFNEMLESFNYCQSELDDIELEITENKEKINQNVDTASIQKKVEQYKSKFRDSVRQQGALEEKIERLKQDKIKILHQIEMLAERNSHNNKLRTYMAYIDAVISDIDNDYNDQEKSIKESINKHVNDYFSKIYHGNRIVEVDEKFNITTTNEINGKKVKTQESPGLQTVKNFSFIAALVEIAKEKRKEALIRKDNIENEEDSNSIIEPYPLVLDAPFSQADEIHVPNICKLISEVAEQTIIVVMEKDWNYAKDIMQNKVGKYYILDKISEQHTEVKLNGGE